MRNADMWLWEAAWEMAPITIGGIYAPNSNQKIYYEELIWQLNDVAEQELLLLGDFNSVLGVQLDKSKQTSAPGLPQFFGFWLRHKA